MADMALLRPPLDPATFAAKPEEVGGVLEALANSRRLMVLFKLVQHGEVTVTNLAAAVGLSQSALSQHNRPACLYANGPGRFALDRAR